MCVCVRLCIRCENEVRERESYVLDYITIELDGVRIYWASKCGELMWIKRWKLTLKGENTWKIPLLMNVLNPALIYPYNSHNSTLHHDHFPKWISNWMISGMDSVKIYYTKGFSNIQNQCVRKWNLHSYFLTLILPTHYHFIFPFSYSKHRNEIVKSARLSYELG